MGRKRTKCRCGMQVQTVLLPRGRFSRPAAVGWALKHGFEVTKVDTTSGHHRIRQRSPSSFVRGSLRTIKLGRLAKAVVGCPKRSCR